MSFGILELAIKQENIKEKLKEIQYLLKPKILI
jgi:hypothetical protein